jgi:hypothetical protein
MQPRTGIVQITPHCSIDFSRSRVLLKRVNRAGLPFVDELAGLVRENNRVFVSGMSTCGKTALVFEAVRKLAAEIDLGLVFTDLTSIHEGSMLYLQHIKLPGRPAIFVFDEVNSLIARTPNGVIFRPERARNMNEMTNLIETLERTGSKFIFIGRRNEDWTALSPHLGQAENYVVPALLSDLDVQHLLELLGAEGLALSDFIRKGFDPTGEFRYVHPAFQVLSDVLGGGPLPESRASLTWQDLVSNTVNGFDDFLLGIEKDHLVEIYRRGQPSEDLDASLIAHLRSYGVTAHPDTQLFSQYCQYLSSVRR